MKKINSICIIDDDVITVYGIRKLLGLVVDCDDITSYANGKLAFESIQEKYSVTAKVPDIIFLDINMPLMDGWQFLDAFFALPIKHSVRIHIVTSSIDILDIQNYERYKKQSHHTLSYNYKPIRKSKIAEIMNPT